MRTSSNSVPSASNRSSRPTSGSPIPAASFSASFACSEPTMPGSTPSTPPSEHDAGRSEGQRRGRAEAAGADQQHARVEQLQLAGDADLGDEGVARVAGALLRAEHARHRDLAAVPLPVGEAARERDDVLVAEVLQALRRERGARAAGAV